MDHNKQQPMTRLLAVQTWVPVLFVVLIVTDSAVLRGQSTKTFRDVGRTPSPQDLFRQLSKHRQPIAETAMFDELQKLGRDVFKGLSPEQQQSARKYAEQLIRDKGIRSPEVSTLLDKMGVPQSAREQLASSLGSEAPGAGEEDDLQAASNPSREQQRNFNLNYERQRKLLEELGQSSKVTAEQLKQLKSFQKMLEGNNGEKFRPQPRNRDSTQNSRPFNRVNPGQDAPLQEASPTDDKQWAESFYKAAQQALPEIQKSIARGDISPQQAASSLDRLKSAVRKLNNDSPGQSDSFKKLFQNGSKLLKSVDGNGQLKEKLEARFDRLLLDAAQASIESAGSDGDASFMQKSLDSLMTSAVELAKDQANGNKKTTLNSILGRNSDKSGSSRRNQSEQANNQFANDQQLAGGANSESGSSADDTTSNSEGSSSAATIFDDTSAWPGWVWLLGLVAVLAAGYAAFQKLRIPANPGLAKQKKLAKVLQSKSMRTPTGLVEAVDLYLVTHHGAQARWWNESMAQDAVIQAQPELRDRISQLFQTYTVSRYQPEERLHQQQCSEAETALRKIVSTHHRVAKSNSVPESEPASEGSGI